MATFKIFKETALPASLQTNSIYLITTGSDHVEMYVTGATAGVVRRIVNETDIQNMINAAVADLASTEIVADITARDALTFTANGLVMVIDATDDPTVSSGAATYAYNVSDSSWTKISEAESMDVTLQWANIVGKPTSTVAEIDDAVSKKHVHANITQLNKISEDADGNMTYNGDLPYSKWTSTNW